MTYGRRISIPAGQAAGHQTNAQTASIDGATTVRDALVAGGLCGLPLHHIFRGVIA